MIASINPTSNEIVRTFSPLSQIEIDQKLKRAAEVFRQYRRTPFPARARMMMKAAEILESEKREFGRLMTTEMGKPIQAAADEAEAEALAKSVIMSSLVKTALFGSDANWGRVLCALGYTPSTFDPNKVKVAFESPRGYLEVCEHGAGVSFSEEKAKLVLGAQEVTILVELGEGSAEATAWGCDLSYEYVRINGDYRT